MAQLATRWCYSTHFFPSGLKKSPSEIILDFLLCIVKKNKSVESILFYSINSPYVYFMVKLPSSLLYIFCLTVLKTSETDWKRRSVRPGPASRASLVSAGWAAPPTPSRWEPGGERSHQHNLQIIQPGILICLQLCAIMACPPLPRSGFSERCFFLLFWELASRLHLINEFWLISRSPHWPSAWLYSGHAENVRLLGTKCLLHDKTKTNVSQQIPGKPNLWFINN